MFSFIPLPSNSVNILLEETINICVDWLFRNKIKVKGLLKQHYKQLLTLAVKFSCLVFNDIYYKLIDGVAHICELISCLSSTQMVRELSPSDKT